MTKRIRPAILLILTLCLLAGCAPGASAPASTSSAQGAPPASAPAANTQQAAAPAASGERPVLTIAKPDIGGVDNTSFNDGLLVWTTIQDNLNIDIEWEVYPGAQYATNAQARLASGQNLPDIIEIPGTVSDAIKYAEQGLLVPLKDLINEHGPDILNLFEKYPSIQKGVTAPNGEIYFVCSYLISSPNGEGLIVRKDWLDQLGMEVPTTTEGWYEVMKGMKENDLNGEGAGSIVPFGGDLRYFLSAFGLVSSQGGNYYWIGDNGEVYFNAMRPEYKEYLAWCNSLYEAGFLDPMYGAGQSQISELEKQNKVGILTNHTGVAAEKDATLLTLGYEGTDNQWVFPPAGPDGKVRWGSLPECRNTLRQGITKDAKDPALAMRFLNYVWASPEGTRLSLCGVEGEMYNLDANGKIVFTDDIINNPQYNVNQRLRHFGAFNYLDIQTYEFNEARVSGKFKDFLKLIEDTPQNVVKGIPVLIPDAQDTSVITELSPDITSYIDEMVIKFISGREPIDQFDSFVEKLKSLGIERLTQTYQTMYDRYQAS